VAKTNRFLIIKIGAIGDIAFALPLPEILRKYYPQSEILWILGDPLQVLLDNNPRLSDVQTVDPIKLFSTSPKKQIFETLRLAKLCLGSYDATFVGHYDLRYALAVRPFVRGPIYYFAREQPTGLQSLYLKHLRIISVVVKPQEIHESHAFRRMAALALGEPIEAKLPWSWDLDYISPESPLSLPLSYWIFQVGGGSNAKTEFREKGWPHWAELCQVFLNTHKEHVVLIGSKSESHFVPEIFTRLNQNEVSTERLHNLVGKTSIKELVSVIRNANGFVGPDSGPMHLADALGIPIVGLFGATSAVSYGVINTKTFNILRHDLPCSPCYKEDGHFPKCPYEVKCMQEIIPNEVLASIDNLLTRI
jgi:ADP-heptose:LPS heptosyltransferase